MMVSVSAKLAFLAVPRAASSSIETEIAHVSDIAYRKPPRAKHMNYKDFTRIILPHLKTFGVEDLETVAVFREPLGWLHSWFCYLKFHPINAGNANHDVDFIKTKMDFNEFTAAYLQDEPPAFARVGQQSRFVANNKGQCGIEHLFKFTNLVGLQDFMANLLKAELLFYRPIAPRELVSNYRQLYVAKFKTNLR